MSLSKMHDEKLSNRAIEILEFERKNWGLLPQKELQVEKNFGLSLVRYYHKLHQVCLSAAAMRYDAILTRKILEKFYAGRIGRGVKN